MQKTFEIISNNALKNKILSHQRNWKYDVEHAVCCAHLLRELNGILENHSEQKWAEHFKILLLNMKKTKEVCIANDKTCADTYYLEMYSRQYDDILKEAYEINPLPAEEKVKKRGRTKKGKIRALSERLDKYKGGVCLFFNDFRVAFDNNQAECDLRMIKVKTKVSGCFHSEGGVRDYLDAMSYIGTAKKHGKNAFQAIICFMLLKSEYLNSYEIYMVLRIIQKGNLKIETN